MNWSLYVASSAALLFLHLGAYAQVPVSAAKSTARETRLDTLRPDSAFSDWRRLAIEGGSKPGETGVVYSRLTPGDPLGLNAPESIGGYWRPLSQSLSSLVETSVVPGALGGSEWSVFGQVAHQLGGGWNMLAGVRHSEFGVRMPDALGATGGLGLGLSSLPPPARGLTAGADLGVVTVERFWNRYRGAYSLLSGRAEGGTTATSHRVQFDYFYDERNSVGLSYTLGRSFESPVGINNAVPTNNVGVVGEHWFSRTWAVNYNALIEDRGIEGLKPEIRLGLRLRF